MGRFKIYKNGDIYVIKSLDREMVFNYVLIVVVLDGFFVFIVKVNVEILDVNDNVLVCDQVNIVKGMKFVLEYNVKIEVYF